MSGGARISWKMRGLLAVCATAIMAAIVCFIILRRDRIALPYRDSFALNNASEWQAFGGVWQLAHGTVFNRSDERGAKLVTGSPHWSDYKMQADLEMIGNEGDIGVIVRAGQVEQGIDSYNGYYIGLRSLDSALVIGRADYGWLEGHPVPVPGGVHNSTWYRLVVVAVGCHLAVQATNLQTGQTAWGAFEEKECVPSGKIGLRSMGTGGAWRNISVTRATEADWQAIRTHAANVQHPEFPILEVDYNRMRESEFAQTYAPAQNAQSSELVFPARPLKESTLAVDALLVPIESLRTSVSPERLLRIRGVVTLADPLYVQDSTGGIAVNFKKPVALNLGDEIEVSGRQTDSGYAGEFEATAIRPLWDRTLVAPLSVSSTQAASGAFNSSLVEVRGYLRSKSRDAGGTITLRIGDESQSFVAILKNPLVQRAYDRCEPGTWLRVSGVCVIGEPFVTTGSAFGILARSPEDIEVLAGPPWWSGERILRIIIPAMLLTVLGIVLYIRIERWKMHGILDERERLAHELHDTLAQTFAGVGFHLQGMRNSIRAGAAPDRTDLMEKLDLACDIVAQTHREASASIAALHSGTEEDGDLLVALEHYATRMLNADNIPLVTTCDGSRRELSLPVSDVLFQVGREAITNVIRHSQATQIVVSMRYEPRAIVLEVRDNGIGFAPGENCGFGIKTMQSRCEAIGAELRVISAPGAGTRISARSPYTLRLTLRERVKHLWSR